MLKKHTVVNPNFILPSIFLKRIRPFIPIITDDYRKAFLISLTSPTYEHEQKEQSVLIQKSMTYFKNLGIEDEAIIMNCIKRDLFLDEISKFDSLEKAEGFILSEVGAEIQNLQQEKSDFEKETQEKLYKKSSDLLESEKTVEQLIEAIGVKSQKLLDEESQMLEMKKELGMKEETIDNLSRRIETLEQHQKEQNEIKSRVERDQLLKEKLLKWELSKAEYLNKQWVDSIPKFRSDASYMLRAILIMFLPIIIAILIAIYKERLLVYASTKGIDLNFTVIYIVLGGVQLLELFLRTYIVDKNRVKDGWIWVLAYFNKRIYKKIQEDSNKKWLLLFIDNNPNPIE